MQAPVPRGSGTGVLTIRHGPLRLYEPLDDAFHINAFRGSDFGHIRRFAQDFPGASLARLEENFRSTGHILAPASAVIARDPSRLGKTLYTRKGRGDPVEVVRFRDAEAEAAGIAAEIVRRHAEDGLPWGAMAVLYRGNALSRQFEEALMHAKVPYRIVEDIAFLQRAEVKDALALLRLATAPQHEAQLRADPAGDEAFRRVANTPARGIGPKAMAALEAEAAFRRVPLLRALETAALPPKARAAGLRFADVVRGVGSRPGLTLADQVALLLEETGYRAMLRASKAEGSEGRLENLAELVQLAGGFHSATDLLEHAALAAGTDLGTHEAAASCRDGAEDRVSLMTLHRSKELEYHAVFLPAWEDGILPSSYGDLSEERRLAYVALTRGMRRVTISHCAWRRGPALPSPFLLDIPADTRTAGWIDQHRAVFVPARAGAAPAEGSQPTAATDPRRADAGRRADRDWVAGMLRDAQKLREFS